MVTKKMPIQAKKNKKSAKKVSGSNVVKGSGGYLGSLAGRGLAWLLGKDKSTRDDWASKGSGVENILRGSGAYAIDKNSFVTGAPFMHSQDPRARICHREFLGNVTGSTLFNIITYDLNPGQPSTFPWLSREAINWEEYKFHGLCFTFRSLSATALNSTNTALGAVCMATQYNSLNPQFTTKIQMEDAQFGVSGKPAEDLVHFVECAASANPLCEGYVRTGPVQGDQRVTDLGKFSIATVGMQASAEIGELWVSYDVEFIKPKLLYEGAQVAQADHWTWTTGLDTANDLLFGSNAYAISNAIGGSIDMSRTYTFPPTAANRYFLVIWSCDNVQVYKMPLLTATGGTVLWTNLVGQTQSQSTLDTSSSFGICTGMLGGNAGGVCYALVHVTASVAGIKLVGGAGDFASWPNGKGDFIVAAYGGPGFGEDPKLERYRTDTAAEAVVTNALIKRFGLRMDEMSDFHKFFLDYRQMEGVTPLLETCVRWLSERRVDRSSTASGRARLDELCNFVDDVVISPHILHNWDRNLNPRPGTSLLATVHESKESDDLDPASVREATLHSLSDTFAEIMVDLRITKDCETGRTSRISDHFSETGSAAAGPSRSASVRSFR